MKTTIQRLKDDEVNAGKTAAKIKDDTRMAIESHRNQQYISVKVFLTKVRKRIAEDRSHRGIGEYVIVNIIDEMVHEQEKQNLDSTD